MVDIPWDMQALLARKYAILQQQADAGTLTAQANAQAAQAASAVDYARAGVIPKESRSQIGLNAAQRALIAAQASRVVPESEARVKQIGAETQLTSTNEKIARREGLTERSILPESLRAVMGTSTFQYPGFQLGF